jgi:hypothetical protein
MTIQAESIIVKGGRFIAGTEANPYQHNLMFIMSGDYYGAQLPMFGNKVIGCLECKFSMYGKERSKTWTSLQSTVAIGSKTLILTEDVDWQIG